MPSLYQVDAFTDTLFSGNPAAVVPLDNWIDDYILQSIAAENNLAETAFIVPLNSGYELRWFTPSSEVALCGHATLATAHVLISKLGFTNNTIEFFTRESGTLTVTKQPDNRLAMSFPSIPVQENPDTELVGNALGSMPSLLFSGYYSAHEFDYLAVFDNAEQIAELQPDLSAFKALLSRGVIVTAAGRDWDFVSRYFAPNFGIDEDPVTGSAHCLLAPYWAEVSGKKNLNARQISARGGIIECKVESQRTVLIGSCVDYLAGEIVIKQR